MWTESTMPIGQSLIVSLLGISIVFLTLMVLSLAIILISRALGAFIKDSAVLMATIGEDLGTTPDRFRILNVTELK